MPKLDKTVFDDQGVINEFRVGDHVRSDSGKHRAYGAITRVYGGVPKVEVTYENGFRNDTNSGRLELAVYLPFDRVTLKERLGKILYDANDEHLAAYERMADAVIDMLVSGNA